MNNDHIFIQKKNRREKVLLDDILYLKACGSSTIIMVKDPEKGRIKFVPSANLKSIAQQVSNPNFLKIHRSFIINRNKVEAIDGRRLVIDGDLIRFSDPYKDIVAAEFPTLKT